MDSTDKDDNKVWMKIQKQRGFSIKDESKLEQDLGRERTEGVLYEKYVQNEYCIGGTGNPLYRVPQRQHPH
ncbi:hypothetical protein FACS189450_00250 [Spirochaetia bacterium]|nr:hypothetical protein FACS189450_00250 [Spirochaetia bacterium]